MDNSKRIKVAEKVTTIDRRTGEVIKQEIVAVTEMDKDTYYRPLVEVLGNDFYKKWQAGELDEGKEVS
ncbi:MAG: hypothetical protein GX958_11770 [Desulfitobacterium sp.]|nr:hypothetical protein [Desulfitobacterium sp.]